MADRGPPTAAVRTYPSALTKKLRSAFGSVSGAGSGRPRSISEATTPPVTQSPTEKKPEPLFAEFPPVSTEAWYEQIREDLGDDFKDKLAWRSLDDLALNAFYRAEDLPEGVPLAVPPTGNTWRCRQDLAAPDLEAARHRLHAALEAGATDLGLAADGGGSGVHGLPLQHSDDLARLLDEAPLDEIAVHCDGLPLFAMLLHVADRRGIGASSLHGSVEYDPIGAWAVGAWPDPHASLDYTTRILAHAEADLPHVRLLTVDARRFHEAGASAVDEVACTLAAASDYLARLTERGTRAQTVLTHMQFIVPVGTSFFVEVGKLRALRLLIDQVAAAYEEQFGIKHAETRDPFIQAVSSRRAETLYDPHMNLLRATTEAAAALVSGCDVLGLRPFDAATLSGPDEVTASGGTSFSRRLARNTSLILRHEAHFDRVADPAGGAYYVEQVTDQLARRAWTRFQEIEARGGLIEALRNGWLQAKLAETRATRAKAAATRRRVQVGINHYPNPDEEHLHPDDAPGAALLERPGPVFLTADDPLAALHRAFAEGAALKDVTAAAPRAESDIEPLPSFRPAEAFEALRLRTERHARDTGRRPLVFLLPVGNAAARSARATFARNAFGCAGFAIEEPAGFASAEEGARAALDAGADLIVLCSTDDAYEEAAPAACAVLKGESPALSVIVAGDPAQLPADALRTAGVNGFVYRGMNMLEALRAYQEHLGIS